MSLRSIRVGPSLAPKHLTVEEVDRLLVEPQVDTPTGVRDLALSAVALECTGHSRPMCTT